jgi:hypothetical protein
MVYDRTIMTGLHKMSNPYIDSHQQRRCQPGLGDQQNMAVVRDYSLTGADGRLAAERGLAGAEWYSSPIPRKRMKELMKRSDQPAIRDTAIWLGAMALSGGLGAWFWGSWIALPLFLCYGVLYGSATDSRWHECGHGTAFKTRPDGAWIIDRANSSVITMA